MIIEYSNLIFSGLTFAFVIIILLEHIEINRRLDKIESLMEKK